MPKVVHFEIAADDTEATQKFYSKVFEWKFDKWDGTNGDAGPIEYWTTKGTGDEKQHGIGGGLMKKMQGQSYGIINYIDVPSVDEFSEKIKSNGGKIIMPKTEIPQVGFIAICSDIEENTFGIIELDEKCKEQM